MLVSGLHHVKERRICGTGGTLWLRVLHGPRQAPQSRPAPAGSCRASHKMLASFGAAQSDNLKRHARSATSWVHQKLTVQSGRFSQVP